MSRDIGSQRDHLVGESADMRALRRAIARLAPLPTTVLITGETGVGKGLVARALHAESPRRGCPFVHVDCTALPPSLIESELFGHERGAFTGAVAARQGHFERAGGGTLFLDEIGDLALPQQAKLLRVLQEREFERVGGNRPVAMEARVIAATNRNLRTDVRSGRFRRDLYYRLDVARIDVPPLRDRASDVPGLISSTLDMHCASYALPAPILTERVLSVLSSHSWPGNVRELSNVAERLLIEYAGRCVDAAELDRVLDADQAPRPTDVAPWREARVERALASPNPSRRIASELDACGGNVALAARRLGLPRSTLRHWIRRYRIR
ncbi:MAG: sigma-54 interaction domain-containing protein [Myxococcota bacterium]